MQTGSPDVTRWSFDRMNVKLDLVPVLLIEGLSQFFKGGKKRGCLILGKHKLIKL